LKTTKKKKTKARKKPRLLDQVIQLTGIPSQTIRNELHSIMNKKNLKPEDINLEQLRNIAATYLREIMGNLLENSHFRRNDKNN
jgi:intergrase/recombinase